MNKLLESLADLLGVSTKALQQLMDTAGVVLPDFIERVARELPLFRLLKSFEFLTFVGIIIFIGATICCTLLNGADYSFESPKVNKINKLFALSVVFMIILNLGIQVLEATLTPTVYGIEYVAEKIGDNND